MKALTTVQNGSQPVSVNFKYEYVDNKKRIQTTTDGKISVPTYQPDRFQISLPKVPVMAYTGEETTVSLDYVNKGRDSVLNVSASLEGDVDTLTPNQNIGNLEAGKSGTITFAVTPLVAGDNEFTITVTYEDANGEEKSRIFPVTLSAEEISYDDTGWDEPMEEAVPETKSLDWKWIAIAVVATLAILVVVMKKRKKAKAAKKEAELWANWDDDMTGSTGSGSSDSGSTGSAGTASGQGEQK
jgi:hypothetical protein